MLRLLTKAGVLALALTVMCAAGALADQITADTDALATTSPHPNGHAAEQTVGTTVLYAYSATVKETGNENDDVFRPNSNDTVTASVSVIESPAGWTVTPQVGSFTWTAYDQNRSGNLSVAVPSSATVSTDAHLIKLKIQVTNISNGRTMNASAGSVTLNYNITLRAATTPTNAAPVITAAAFTADDVDCRNQATLSVTFTDADGPSPWTYSVDWDNDGTYDDVDVATGLASPGTFTATHTYNTPGTYIASVIVKDAAPAASSAATDSIAVNQTYTVGFLAPFDTSNPSLAVINRAKAGRVVPVKATVFDDCALEAIDGGDAEPRIAVSKATTPTGSTTDGVESYSDAGAANNNGALFRWSSDGFWIYNLDTKALALVTGQTYRVDVYQGLVKASDDEWALLATVK